MAVTQLLTRKKFIFLKEDFIKEEIKFAQFNNKLNELFDNSHGRCSASVRCITNNYFYLTKLN